MIIVANEVRKRFGALEVLKGISLAVAEGEVLCIIGPSGSGAATEPVAAPCPAGVR